MGRQVGWRIIAAAELPVKPVVQETLQHNNRHLLHVWRAALTTPMDELIVKLALDV